MHLKIWARENDIRDKARKIDLQKKWTTFIKKKKKQNKEESKQDYLQEKEIFWEIYKQNRKEEEES